MLTCSSVLGGSGIRWALTCSARRCASSCRGRRGARCTCTTGSRRCSSSSAALRRCAPARARSSFRRETSCIAPKASTACTRSRTRLMTRCESSRSEEHTSELQSRRDLVCRLLLEKKKKKAKKIIYYKQKKKKKKRK